ncbi:MAG: hypothetical protein JWO09_934 [Bacteroidetes bacterium]|nr:hypothetical protein [Bacteroidota bacterium]
MKIIVNWDYDRPDLMKAFAALKDDFRMVFLFKNQQPASGAESIFNPGDVIYWNSFQSPYQLLAAVNPDKIIFHDIESFLQVGLNIAAQNKGIKTMVMEHGLRGSYEVDIALQRLNTPASDTIELEKDPDPQTVSGIGFYLRSFRMRNILSARRFLRFPFIRRKYGLAAGLFKAPFRLREANLYINFTLHNASYILKRDHIQPGKVLPIGNPNFDEIFAFFNSNKKETGNYFLLIDAPYCEQSIFGMKKEVKAAFYRKLNEFCLEKNAELKIKLHPHSYHADYLPADPNMEYLRECNTARYIASAQGCFMINLSTLSPLAMYYSKCIYFNSGINPYDKDLAENRYLPAYDFNTFSPAELEFTESSAAQKDAIKKAYLYATDGKATERLKQILLH